MQDVHVIPDGYFVSLRRARLAAANTEAMWTVKPPVGSYLLYATVGVVNYTTVGGGIFTIAANTLASIRAFVRDNLVLGGDIQYREIDFQTPDASSGNARIMGVPTIIGPGEDLIIIATTTGGAQDLAGTLSLFPAAQESHTAGPKVS